MGQKVVKPGFSQPVYMEEEAKNFFKYLVEGLKQKKTEEISASALAKLCKHGQIFLYPFT